eukprot:2434577-Rhodomonas_salina.1
MVQKILSQSRHSSRRQQLHSSRPRKVRRREARASNQRCAHADVLLWAFGQISHYFCKHNRDARPHEHLCWVCGAPEIKSKEKVGAPKGIDQEAVRKRLDLSLIHI